MPDSLGGGLEVDHALVNSHLIAIPGLGTFSVRGLTGCNTESLGWHTDGALNILINSKLKSIQNKLTFPQTVQSYAYNLKLLIISAFKNSTVSPLIDLRSQI